MATQIAAAQKAEAEAENETGAWGSQDEVPGSRPGRGAAAETVAGAMTLAVVLGVSAMVALELGSDAIIGWAGGDATAAVTATATAAAGAGAGSNVSTEASSVATISREAEAYLRVRALSAPAALVQTVAVGAYRGLLDTRTPLLVSGATNAVNLVGPCGDGETYKAKKKNSPPKRIIQPKRCRPRHSYAVVPVVHHIGGNTLCQLMT